MWPASPSGGGDASSETWQPRFAVAALAERNGRHIERLKVDDGCYEIKGRDAQGRRFEAEIDPAPLQVMGVKREHVGGDREREREREQDRQRLAGNVSSRARA